MCALGPGAALAQSAGCAAIDGFSSDLVQVRVSETLTPLAFSAGEVITLTATSVTATVDAGDPVWAFADASEVGGFGDGAFSPFYSISASPISETVTIPDGGIEGLALTEAGGIFTDLNGVSVTCGIMIIPTGPTSDEEIARLTAAAAQAGRMVVLDARTISRMRGRESLATRDAMMPFANVTNAGAVTVTQSTMGHNAMMGNVFAWVEFTGFRAEDDSNDRDYSGRGIQIGADMAVSPDMVVGLSFGAQDLDSSVGAFDQDGILRFVQPYLAYRSGAWSAEASFLYGHGDFDQTSSAGTGEAETRLHAATFTGGYDLALDAGLTVTPMIGLVHGLEKVEGVSGTLEDTDAVFVRFTEASLGAELSQSISGGEVFVGLHADWLDTSSDTALVSDLLIDDGWTGRVAVGVAAEIGHGLDLDTSIEVSGLGGDLRQTSGSIRFAFRF
jgi:hypothetical protein